MILETAELIQQSELAQLLRNSLWLYPLVNTGHILGIILLVGSTLTIDCRILGLWARVKLQSVATVFQTLVVTGLILTALFGLLLFIARPVDYLGSEVFLIKLALIVVALTNALILRNSNTWKTALSENKWGFQVKAQALISLLLWLTILFLGRLIAYR